MNETHQVQDVVDKYVERVKHKMNLILHNVPEQREGSFQDRIEKDIHIFKIIVNTELAEQNVSVTRAIKLGKYIEGKKRLMLVKLKDENVKRGILKKAKSLRTSGPWRNVYISLDLTPKERMKGTKLGDEMRLTQQAGEANLMIRRDRIVVRNEVNSQEQQINGKEQKRRGQMAPPSSIEVSTPLSPNINTTQETLQFLEFWQTLLNTGRRIPW